MRVPAVFSFGTVPVHPYFPVEAPIIDYVPNTYDGPALLGIISTVAGAVLTATYLGLRSRAPWLRESDRLIILWFILSGCLHLFFESYFVLHHQGIASSNNILAQLWKEYALSDSRYVSSDPFVLCVEVLSVTVWGPLSLTTAYLIATQHALRHSLQTIVSVGHLYGDTLYYVTCFFELHYRRLSYCRPEAYYFWVYFFIMNSFWIVIPSVLLYQSCSATARVFKTLDKLSNISQRDGRIKKDWINKMKDSVEKP